MDLEKFQNMVNILAEEILASKDIVFIDNFILLNTELIRLMKSRIEYLEQENFVEYYFSNLRNNFDRLKRIENTK